MYKIVLKSEAEKFLKKKLDRNLQIRISNKIDQLGTDPFADNNNLTKLKDMQNGYRLRIGNIRVIYEIDTISETILIWRVGWRSSVYLN